MLSGTVHHHIVEASGTVHHHIDWNRASSHCRSVWHRASSCCACYEINVLVVVAVVRSTITAIIIIITDGHRDDSLSHRGRTRRRRRQLDHIAQRKCCRCSRCRQRQSLPHEASPPHGGRGQRTRRQIWWRVRFHLAVSSCGYPVRFPQVVCWSVAGAGWTWWGDERHRRCWDVCACASSGAERARAAGGGRTARLW
jgi:hypothetical protein